MKTTPPMQLSGLSVKYVAALMLAAALPSAALADPVYLLQLGSYDNLQEARSRWSELRTKYPDLLKEFSARFQDVNLPPDNFVVYRTQAGALKDKADAERVCERITSRGDECYVVETAMFRPDLAPKEEPPLSIVNSVAPDGTVQPQKQLPDMAQGAQEAVQSLADAGGEIVKAPTMTRRVITPGADIPAMPKPQLPTASDVRMPRAVAPSLTAPVAPSIDELADMASPRMSAPAMPSVPMPSVPAVPSYAKPSSQALSISKPALKISRPALKSDVPVAAMAAAPMSAPSMSRELPVSRVTPEVAMPDMPASPKLSARVAAPDMPAAPRMVAPSLTPDAFPTDRMDGDHRSAQDAARAIVFPDQRPAAPAMKAPVSPPKEEGSFWSAINPFSSDEQLAKDEIIIEKPQEDHSVLSSLDPFSSAPEKQSNFPAKPAARVAQQASPRPIDPETAVMPSPKEVAAFGFPPPPAPSSDQTMQVVRQQRDAALARRSIQEPISTATQTETAVPVPFATSSDMKPASNEDHVLKAPPSAMPPVAPIAKRKTATGADVEVAEAVRVPLTERKNPLPLDQTLSAKLPATGVLKRMGTPSATADDKTLWAQIYHFDSQQAALAYWEAFRKRNPSFPPVRVRVTSPYANMLGQEKKVSLRIGPFDLASQVNDLCDEVQSQDMNCKAMSEVGGSAVASFNREHGGSLSGRYEQAQAQQAAAIEPMYWVQLGSYATQGKAEEGWNKLASRHKPLLDTAKSNVASPIMSSSMQPVYRLRSGPYAMRNSADQLCASMKASGSDCMVVFSR